MTPSDSPNPKIEGRCKTELYHFEVSIGRNTIFLNIGCKIEEGVIRFLSHTRSYFSGLESLCKISSESNQNCGRRSV